MKRLIVCGDSFMSPRLVDPKKHFSEIFAERLGFDLVSYARSGFGNGGISIQIETAIQQKPDLILFNTTNADRIEMATGNQHQQSNFRVRNLGDTNYRSLELSDSYYEFNDHKTLVSANLTSLLGKQPDKHWEELYLDEMGKRFVDWEDKIHAVSMYVKHIYSENWKQQVDKMIMYTTMHRLHLSQIPYIFVHDWLGLLNSKYNPFWLENKNNVTKLVNDVRVSDEPTTIGFHLTYGASQTVADILIDHYTRYF